MLRLAVVAPLIYSEECNYRFHSPRYYFLAPRKELGSMQTLTSVGLLTSWHTESCTRYYPDINKWNSNKNRKQTHQVKICQLTDDTTLFLKSQNEIMVSLDIVEEFVVLSGLQFNRNKTKGLWLGN